MQLKFIAFKCDSGRKRKLQSARCTFSIFVLIPSRVEKSFHIYFFRIESAHTKWKIIARIWWWCKGGYDWLSCLWGFKKWFSLPCPHLLLSDAVEMLNYDAWWLKYFFRPAVLHQQCIYESVLITVINELEGLSRGMVKPTTSTSTVVLCEKLENPSKLNKSGSRRDPQHAAMVTQASKSALAFLKSKQPAVK